MPISHQAVCTIKKDGITYRFTDCLSNGQYWTGRQVLDNGKVGKVIHRITREEMAQAVIDSEDVNI